MKKSTRIENNDEPLGIVISRGSRHEAPPMFAAYVWGPAPEGVLETTGSKAA
jgi:hypothetical protein